MEKVLTCLRISSGSNLSNLYSRQPHFAEMMNLPQKNIVPCEKD